MPSRFEPFPHGSIRPCNNSVLCLNRIFLWCPFHKELITLRRSPSFFCQTDNPRFCFIMYSYIYVSAITCEYMQVNSASYITQQRRHPQFSHLRFSITIVVEVRTLKWSSPRSFFVTLVSYYKKNHVIFQEIILQYFFFVLIGTVQEV